MRKNTIGSLALASALAWVAASSVQAGWVDQTFYPDAIVNGTIGSQTAPAPAGSLYSLGGFPNDPSLFGYSGLLLNQISNGDQFAPLDYVEGGRNIASTYGSMLQGFLEAPVTGAYTIWVTGFQDTELWMITNAFTASMDINPRSAGYQARRIAFIAPVANGHTAAGSRVYNTSLLTQRSRKINLVKGSVYFFRIVQANSQNGGDHCSIGWQRPDLATERPVPVRYTQRVTPSPTGFGNYAFDQQLLSSAPIIVQQAGTILTGTGAVAANNPGNPYSAIGYGATTGEFRVKEKTKNILFVNVEGTQPLTYQWAKGGSPITGAILSSLDVTNDTISAGETYTCTISGVGTPAVATINLITEQDNIPPYVTSAATLGNPTGLSVFFSEPLSLASATNINNYKINLATVTKAELQYGTNQSVIVLTITPFTGGGPVLTVTNLVDLATTPNNIKDDPQRRWTVPISIVDGIVLKETYLGISGDNQIQRIYDLPTFRNNPSESEYISRLECPDQPARDNWGSEVRGVLIPSETADYVFYIAADDEAVLYLSTDEEARKKRMIAVEPQWNDFRSWATTDRRNSGDFGGFTRTQEGVAYSIPDEIGTPVNRSDNIPHGFSDAGSGRVGLEAGRKYYIEAIFKDGGGGGHMAVTWVKAGAPTPANGTATAITAQFLGLAQAGATGPLAITKQPTNIVVQERFDARLSATASGSQIITYQWFEVGPGGVPVIMPDDTRPDLLIPLIQFSDSGRSFFCVMFNAFSKATSSNATLTVIQDTTAPAFYRAVGSPLTNTVTISFTEPVDRNTVNASSFRITRPGVSSLPFSLIDIVNRTNVVLAFAHSYQTNYTITHIGSVKDLAETPNSLAANAVITFTGFVQSRGWLVAEEYWSIGGTSIPDLTNNSRYINKNPNRTRFVSMYESHPNGDLTTVGGPADNYGVRIWGWLIPPTSGDYTFYISADDNAQLWLSTSSDPNLRVQIATEPEWNNARQWTVTDRRPSGQNISAVKNLAAGTPYYTEFLFKEGGGGDNGAVTWRAPGEGVPGNGSEPRIRGLHLMSYQNPDGTSITFNQNAPASVTNNEGSQRTLTLDVTAGIYDNSNAPKLFQWQMANPGSSTYADIGGANGTSYQTPFLVPADQDRKYRCVVYTLGRQATSAVTTMSIIADLTPPTVVSVSTMESPVNLLVKFSERVNATDANTASKYVIPGLTVQSATLQANGTDVLLLVTAQVPGTTYTNQITGIRDVSVAQTVLSPNPTLASFIARSSWAKVKREVWYNIGGGWVSDLTNNDRFRNNQPDRIDYINRVESVGFDWGWIVDEGGWYAIWDAPNRQGRDNYGIRMTFMLTVPTTGEYEFAVAGDDQTFLYVSTDMNPANKRFLCAEPEWSGFRTFENGNGSRAGSAGGNLFPGKVNVNRSTNTVGTITLQANTPYYAEVLFKEGGGGDFGSAAMKLKGSSEPMSNDNENVVIFANRGGATYATTLVDPNLTVNFTTQPQNASILDGQTVNLSAAFTLPVGPADYKWQSSTNGGSTWQDVTGTGASGRAMHGVTTTANYTTPGVDISVTGIRYRLAVTIPINKAVASSTATITVSPPSLTITKSGVNAIVSWPQVPNYKLQSTGVILPASTAWADETNDIFVVNNANTKTNATTGGTNQVFRLRKP